MHAAFSSYDFDAPPMRRLVRSAWGMSHGASTEFIPGLVAPDAHVEFIFHFGSPSETVSVASPVSRLSPRAMIYAQRRGALRLRSTGENTIIAFRASAAVASHILRHSLGGCWDEPISLSELIGREADDLADRLADAPPAGRPEILGYWIEARLGDWGSDDAEADAVQEALLWRAGSDKLTDFADALGFGVRTLRRRCATFSGLSPKQLANSGRILRACLLLRENPVLPIVEIAHALGFSDQAAFANLFRNRVGMTPARFRAEPLVFCERPREGESPPLSAFCKTTVPPFATSDEEEFGGWR